MDVLRKKIDRSCKYGTLDYKWAIREYIFSNRKERSRFMNMLTSLSDSSFLYYAKYRDTIEKDASLKAITMFCTNPELTVNLHISDADLEFLSELFNQMLHSTRTLHRCYDCGTNARAMFLKLISTHRQQPYLSPNEQIRMLKQYVPRGMNSQ